MFTEGRLTATGRAQRLGEELAMRNEELSEVAEGAGARSFCLTQRAQRHRVFYIHRGSPSGDGESTETGGGISNEE